MYHAGLDPFTKRPVHTARNLTDRRMQRALMPFFKPENDFTVREALIQAVTGSADVTGWSRRARPRRRSRQLAG